MIRKVSYNIDRLFNSSKYHRPCKTHLQYFFRTIIACMVYTIYVYFDLWKYL